ncbi:MAG TPA: hypothetical protein VF532_23520, partial [Candidatus Angelobacter sp.]
MTLRRILPACFCVLLLFSLCAAAQRPREDRPPGPAAAPGAPEQTPRALAATEPKKEVPEQPPVVTHHEIRVGGKTLRYTATAGMMPLKNTDTGETEAHIFYMA